MPNALDLDGTCSAFAGFFWDSKSNWIIISFKGTGPIEFGYWVSDFTALLVPIGVRVKEFSKADGGFPTGFWSQSPYDSILEGVKALAGFLRSNNKFGDDTKVCSSGWVSPPLTHSDFVLNTGR